MVNDLRGLLGETADTPYDEGFDPATLLAAGRARMRRRRRRGIAVAAAALALVAGGVGALRLVPASDEPPVLDPVPRSVRVVGAVPVTAAPGFAVVAEHTVEDQDQREGLAYRALLGDGAVLVSDGQPYHPVLRWGVLGGTEPAWFPSPGAQVPDSFLGESGGRLVFEWARDADLTVLWFLDRGTGRWSNLPVDLTPLGPDRGVYDGTGFALGGERLWVAVAGGTSGSRLWSRPLTPTGTWRDEGAVDSYAVDADSLVTISAGPDPEVVIRDLGDGSTASVEAPGNGCTALEPAVGSRYAAVPFVCGDRQVTLVTALDGTPVATVAAPAPVVTAGDADRFLFKTTEGAYVVDVPSLRVLQLTRQIATGGGDVQGDRILWTSTVSPGSAAPNTASEGKTFHVAELPR